jgi:hypothetical protein
MAEEKCRLLAGTFAFFVQAFLALVCVGTLVVKRQQEVPRRDWLVWFFDAMKQGMGASFGHFSNIYLSMVIASQLSGGDECQWYCLTYVFDATLGTAFNIIALRALDSCLRRYATTPPCLGVHTLLKFGEYGSPPQMSVFLSQLSVWLSIVILNKLLIVCLLALTPIIQPLDKLISLLFQPLHNTPKLELVLVMILIPSLLNSVQFWVTDSFLKRSTGNTIHRHLEGEGLDDALIRDTVHDKDLSSKQSGDNSNLSSSLSVTIPRFLTGNTYPTHRGKYSTLIAGRDDDIEGEYDYARFNNNNIEEEEEISINFHPRSQLNRRATNLRSNNNNTTTIVSNNNNNNSNNSLTVSASVSGHELSTTTAAATSAGIAMVPLSTLATATNSNHSSAHNNHTHLTSSHSNHTMSQISQQTSHISHSSSSGGGGGGPTNTIMNINATTNTNNNANTSNNHLSYQQQNTYSFTTIPHNTTNTVSTASTANPLHAPSHGHINGHNSHYTHNQQQQHHYSPASRDSSNGSRSNSEGSLRERS